MGLVLLDFYGKICLLFGSVQPISLRTLIASMFTKFISEMNKGSMLMAMAQLRMYEVFNNI
jgi:hypothetical protein